MQFFVKFWDNFPREDIFPYISLILNKIPDISPAAVRFPNIMLFSLLVNSLKISASSAAATANNLLMKTVTHWQ